MRLIRMDQHEVPREVVFDGDDIALQVNTPRKRPRYSVWLVLLLLLLINLTNGITNIPLSRILERRLCRAYYDTNNDPDEELCKVDRVQQDLAWIMGGVETLWIVGDFTMTLPLTFLAERYGRKIILLLNLVPRFFMLFWTLSVAYFQDYLPPRAAIAGAALSVLGGDTVFNSLIYGLAARLTEDTTTRAIYFGRMTALTSVVGFLSPAIAAAAMTLRLSLPLWLGVMFLLLALPTLLLLPTDDETNVDDTGEARRPLISSPTLKARGSHTRLLASVIDRIRSLISSVGNLQLTLLLVSMLLTSLASADTKLLAQYISTRYHWTFASAGYLLSAKAIVNFFLLTFVVPVFLTTHATGSQSLSDQANIRYARFCLVSSVLGALAIGVSGVIWELVPSLLIYALGVPLSIFTLSLANSPAMWARSRSSGIEASNPQSHVFSIVMMVKTLGSLIGAPLMATIWYYGIEFSFYGSPYIASSLIYLASWCVFWNIRVD